MPVDPASLHIIKYPAEVLREKARPVPRVTDEVRTLAQRMIELMREAEGIGLAANQVGIPWRMFVAHVPALEGRSTDAVPPTATGAPVVYINPVLSEPSKDLVSYEEGCLSLPSINGEVRRPSEISITALGLDAEPFTARGGDLLARCWQHEIDHLDGVLIIDRMTQLSRMKNRNALRDLGNNARLM